MAETIKIGAMHSFVSVYKRSDVPDPHGSGMIESLELIAEVAADIQPTGPITFYGSITADYEKPVSHRIFTRWFSAYDPTFDLNYQINRTLTTPDRRLRIEKFRVWRHLEIDGKLRFIQFDSQLEIVTND